MYYVNENIKNTLRIFPQQGRHGFMRLDMNENPSGLPKDFVDEVLAEITPEYLATYPEPDNFLNAYADFIGVNKQNLCITNGSDAAIRYTLETFAQKGSSVVTVAPSFEMYAVNCNLLGLKHKPVMYMPNLTINADDIVNAIDDTTDVVVLLNPNNPISTAYTDEEANKIILKARSVGAIVIIDEAYHYFYKKTFLNLIHQYDNVIIFRTFSKLFSLAGCRLGIIISNPQIIDYVTRSKPSFEVNTIALKFAERLIQRPELIQALIDNEAAGRKYLIDSLNQHSYDYFAENGNFIFIKPKLNPTALAEKLKENKILVKTYGNPMLDKYIRINTGNVDIMKKFLDIFYEMDKE